MRVMVVAGEASGDHHGASVLAELRRLVPSLEAFGMGGPALRDMGVECLHGIEELSVMGLVEVLPRIPRILGLLRSLERAAAHRRPALALLVDAPDFNLRLAAKLKTLGIPVAQLVAPTVWAWRSSRTETLRRVVDLLLCILPFEEALLRAAGVNAHYVGSPVLDQLPAPAEPAHFRRLLQLEPDGQVLALLPGSRRSELSRMLPVMAETAAHLVQRRAGLQVVVPLAPGVDPDTVLEAFRNHGVTPRLVQGRAPEVVGASDAAVVTSGTATLEAALMRRPFVVVYRLAWPTYAVARRLVRIRHFSLPNLLADAAVVPELLQRDVTADRVAATLDGIWDGAGRDRLLRGLDAVRATLGPPGAAARAARLLLRLTRAC